MFYCHEILQKRNGTFGIVWLAATNSKKLTRREYESVHITKKCTEILDYILENQNRQAMRLKFSLYLSAQLMFGTVKIYSNVSNYLLQDCKEAMKKCHTVFVNTNDLSIPKKMDKKRKKLCLTEDFSALDIGTFVESPFVHAMDVWIPDDVELSFLRDATVGEGDTLPPHTALSSAFTLPENSESISVERSVNEVNPAHDLQPDAEFERMFHQAPPLSPIQHALEIDPFTDVNQTAPVPEANLQQLNEMTPAIAPPVESTRLSKKRSGSDEELPAKKKISLSGSMALPPLEIMKSAAVALHRQRKRHLIIDDPTYISKEEMKRCKEMHEKTCAPPCVMRPGDFIARTAQQLLMEPSQRFLAREIKMKYELVIAVDPATALLSGPEQQRFNNETYTSIEKGRDASSLQQSGIEPNLAETSDLRPAEITTPTTRRFPPKTNLRDRSRIETPSHDLQIPEALPEEQQIPVPELAQLIIDQEIPLADGEVNPDQPDQLQQTPALIVEPEDLHGKVANTQDVGGKLQKNRHILALKLKTAFERSDTVTFDQIAPYQGHGTVSRKRAAQLFSALLSATKRQHVEISQESDLGSITIQKGRRWG